ncbi:AAA family ATPase [Cerasicoccus arenae]|uniref:ATPase AAA n=1 Tax=Cerasicoccus arenae TaxID=424488 RepID=A0A8J3DIP6_9BACT|nr:MoxR family ATPase [Cerasicoccus arenae]MBK1857994.1 MoxR family ATPase [Cerasicoccus arenae]GHB97590.1 ATPase AAA [Cerasicoccus arenae]
MSQPPPVPASGETAVARVHDIRDRLMIELRKAVVGQDDVIEQLVITMLARGHALLTGVPGLGKTLLVRSIAESLSLGFKRIQFTPDLMPADIFGTEVVEEDPATGKRAFRFVKGPIFANVVLADEINRTPPKTQAALLEAMEERQVTAAGETHQLAPPFFVLATQNPIELEGTYPLPEAQLDRFLLNVVMDYLPAEDEVAMVSSTTSPNRNKPDPVLTGPEIEEIQALVRSVPVSTDVVRYAVRLVSATRPTLADASALAKEKIKWGAGSRASQALVLAGKARALLDGRYNVSVEDIKALAQPVLRHRVIPSFHAEAEGVTSDQLIQELLKTVEG